MDKDRVKGTIDDAVGRAKRQAGEWTGDTQTQAEGTAQQVKGKAEKAWGNVKDAARDAGKDMSSHSGSSSHVDRPRDNSDVAEEDRDRSVTGHDKNR